MVFCPVDVEEPISCPMSLGTIGLEIVIIFITLLLLCLLSKYSREYSLGVFPISALVMLLVGSTFAFINSYYWYQFNHDSNTPYPQ